MANEFSYLALALAIPAGILLFFALRTTTAVLVVFLSFVMFLPELVVLDAPGVPGIGKLEAASVACLLGLLLRGRRRLRAARPFRGPEAITLLLFVCNVMTVLTNRDPLTYGTTFFPGLTSADVVSSIYKDLLWYTVPFLVGRTVVTTSSELKQLLVAVALAGALYTPFVFTELVMSPQLNRWIYGFYQHTFAQTFRGGGFRPMVFMAHGLAVGLFMSWAALAALTLSRARRATLGLPSPLVAVYNGGFLAACKSLGAFLYGLGAGAVLLVAPPRVAARVAFAVGVLVLAYPACRTYDLFPVERVESAARMLSAERAESLSFRLDMEELVVDHVAKRPWFGWGWYGRNHVYHPEAGYQMSVTDGHWVVILGVHGVLGFAGTFTLIVWPLFPLRKRLRRIEQAADRTMLVGLAMMVAIGALDLIPNGLFSHLVVFLAGALAGASRGIADGASPPAPSATAAGARARPEPMVAQVGESEAR